MEYPDKNVHIYQSGSPILNHIEPIVKITVSPNTPSPEPQEEQSSNIVESTFSDGESFRECSVELTDVGAMGGFPCYRNLEECQTSNAAHYHGEQQQHVEVNSSKDLPICFDFGIQDYLCRRVEETEFDLSSDTDTSYLGTTPPFGEIDICQSSIEAMPILLDTQLNLQEDQFTKQNMEELASRLSLNMKDSKSSQLFGKSMSKESLLSFHATSPHNPNDSKGDNHKSKLQERRFPRPFRRNISLPAMFKSYLQNTEFSSSRDKSGHEKGGMMRADTLNSTNKSTTSTHHRLSRIESISNSSQINLADETQDSLNSSVTSVNSNWNISGSIDSDVEEPFTSEIEKRSLMIRHMRSLIRQNTTGNFAPADYHI